jgi:cytochrome c-type biogenesis protein CcmH/NrfF
MASPLVPPTTPVRAAALAQAPAPVERPASGGAAGPSKPSFEAEQAATALSNELMSPFCPGRTLSACPSENARKVERWMATEFDAGRSKAEIKAELEVRFGDKVGTQLDGTILAISGALALLGLFVVILVARRWRAGARATAAAGGVATPVAAAREGAAKASGAASRDEAGRQAPAPLEGASADELEDLEAELERIDRL